MTADPDIKDMQQNVHLRGVQVALQGLIDQLTAIDMTHVDPAVARRLHALTRACLDAGDLAYDTDFALESLVDRTVFDHLMVMAGPETARDLLIRLTEDLVSVRQMLETAMHPPDWDALRTQSHILIGLAGAIGADALCAQAQKLNDLTHQANGHQLTPVMAQITPQIAALLRFVQMLRSEPALTR
jgi:HPt (histidine-containing phosphotransfer) domain-containing protein